MFSYENRKMGSDGEDMLIIKTDFYSSFYLVICDVIISFDASVNGEKRSLETFGDRRVKVTSFLFAHVENDMRRIVNTAGGAILLDIFIQNRHFLIGFFEKRKRFIKRDYTASMG